MRTLDGYSLRIVSSTCHERYPSTRRHVPPRHANTPRAGGRAQLRWPKMSVTQRWERRLLAFMKVKAHSANSSADAGELECTVPPPTTSPGGCKRNVGHLGIPMPLAVRFARPTADSNLESTLEGRPPPREGPTSCVTALTRSPHHTPCHSCDQSANGNGNLRSARRASQSPRRESCRASSR